MKILIIGAGISGLLSYLSLSKHLSDSAPALNLTIYESHSSPASIGGGIGLAPNGLRAIASVSPTAVRYIQERASPAGVFTVRNSDGRHLGDLPVGRPERYPGLGHIMLRRSIVLDALLREVPDGAVVWGKKAMCVNETEGGVVVEFEDGDVEVADLVIGADGLRSVTRQSVFGDGFPPTYTGFTTVGGFIPMSRLPTRLRDSFQDENVTMTFGSPAAFAYSPISPPEDEDAHIQWWSIYESDTPPSRDLPPSTVIRDNLLTFHASWKSPYDEPHEKVIESIIRLGCDPVSSERLLMLPSFTIPRLSSWTSPSGKVILVGDAAHAMPPDIGQGISLAAEDAVALSLLLKHYLTSPHLGLSQASGLAKTAKAYEEMRMSRVGVMLDIAKWSRLSKGKLNWFQRLLRDWIFRIMCRLPEWVHDSAFGYDVVADVENYISKA